MSAFLIGVFSWRPVRLLELKGWGFFQDSPLLAYWPMDVGFLGRRTMLKKLLSSLKHVFAFGLSLMLMSPAAYACSVCFGESSDDMAIGHNWSVMTLLAIIVFVLICFASFFVYLGRKAKKFSVEPSAPAQAIERG